MFTPETPALTWVWEQSTETTAKQQTPAVASRFNSDEDDVVKAGMVARSRCHELD
jgi:hypothetical protein